MKDKIKDKVCFVVMGFGKKTYFKTNETVDLDEVYNEVIKPLFAKEFQDYKLIRADDIAGSAIIDVSMYELLLHADLVIADLTTNNVNAAYELGVRHAVKPFSTVIMMQDNHDIPFDLGHSRIYRYKKFGEKISRSESEEMMSDLQKFIYESEKHQTDSPLYTYIPEITPPAYDKGDYKKIVSNVEKNSNTIGSLLEKANRLKKEGKFFESKKCWNKLIEKSPKEDYFVQQLALATYKSEKPTKTEALMDALEIIQRLPVNNTLDTETLGICGAIYKNLYKVNNNPDYLTNAIICYRKGYLVKQNYYNGENYANCLLLQLPHITDDKRKIYNQLELEDVYGKLINIIDEEEEDDDYWKFATLATAYYYLGDNDSYEKYKTLFEKECYDWEQSTFVNTIKDIDSIKRQLAEF